MTYQYHSNVLDELARHGLKPLEDTPPDKFRDAVSELYKYEIRRLRGELVAGRIRRQDYAGHVVDLRKRYWLLSIPVQLWVSASRRE